MPRVELIALGSVPLVKPGDDLGDIILRAAAADHVALTTGDVIVVAQKIVSKAQDRYVRLDSVSPSARAHELAAIAQKDARLVELILRESREVLRCSEGVIVVETHHGLVLANAGIDRSNVDQTDDGERVLLLPTDPDGTCSELRRQIATAIGVDIGVVINDSLGRAWRMGTIGAAIGVSGISALTDMRGKPDLFGFRLRVTEIATADEIAAAASLLMGQGDENCPVIVVRGLRIAAEGKASDLIRPREKDLFR